ncbi:MAG: glycosyltransferase family 2 protein [Bacteroidales bacterium]
MKDNLKLQPLVSVITVNYNHSADTIAMIYSLKNCSYKNIEIIVIDNDSQNDDPYIISKTFPDIKLIVLPNNLGFAGGNNEGFRYSTGEYLLLLNNDTELDPGFLEPLVETLQSNSEIGMVSPRLLFYHSPEMKTIQYAGACKINLLTGRGRNIGWSEVDNGQYNYVCETDYAHGAALMLNREVLTKVGCMPDVFFLYYEEHDWCTAMQKKGLKAYYVGTSKVFHKESVSIGKNSPVKTYYMTRNRIIFLRRNANWINFTIAILFFLLISVPVGVFRYLKNKESHLLKYYFSAILWNFTHFKNLNGFPKLVTSENKLAELSGTYHHLATHSNFVKSINKK